MGLPEALVNEAMVERVCESTAGINGEGCELDVRRTRVDRENSICHVVVLLIHSAARRQVRSIVCRQ